jgi:hypothetical protein
VSLARHLDIQLERESAAKAPPDDGRQGLDSEALYLPDSLRNPLVAAAHLNAITQIEQLIEELRELSPPGRCLAQRLDGLLAGYDMEGTATLVERIPPEPVGGPPS